MRLSRNEFLKYVCVLHLLGVKHLGDTSLDDMFSRDPIMREDWLCRVTNRRDLGRFLRQASARVSQLELDGNYGNYGRQLPLGS